MEYYYTPKENINKNYLYIIGDERKHLAKVLRKKIGDKIEVTDGELSVYECKIIEIEKERIKCEIINKKHNVNEPALKIRLFIGQLRNHDRFEFAIEKAVELGVNQIYPVISKYTVTNEKLNETKLKRLSKIIISAMSQSQRCFLPILHKSVSFDELLELTRNDKEKIVMYEFSGSENKLDEKISSDTINLLIGPEGGFSEDEINQLKNNGWKVKSLGERKLRAETAAIVSLYRILNN
ncbi:MAG TPA: RsmE family RNA methyltransferase [Ignavibacteria bacterium]|nr:RsmE family RNA methyltransferase [Ignavibacteria bacterium]